ncbi:hypothetical protein [Muricoccus aerilatus]|uniref:hypothetical protein n=1 Tax=Muricoccus aerilatus TaxID=452982 RepID=UPI0005C13404|nr:hypothetical protein [Roseomonas aerilata]
MARIAATPTRKNPPKFPAKAAETARRKPPISLAPKNKGSTKPPAKAPPAPVIRGWAEFRENGGELIKHVALTGNEVALSSSKTVPHVRLRRAANCPDEVAALRKMWGETAEGEPSCELLFAKSKKHLLEVRSLVVTGRPVLLRSGKAIVLADRHPDCPHSFVDAYLAHEKAHGEQGTAHRTLVWARRAARRTREIQSMNENIEAAVLGVTRGLAGEIRDFLKEVTMNAETKDKMEQMLKRLQAQEGAKAYLEKLKLRTAADLERY